MNSGTSSSALGSRLESRVQGFVDRLREQGLRSGLTAGVDLSRALNALPLLNRDAVREACRATLAKSPAELAIVDRVFEEYFGSLDLPVTPASEEGKLPHSRERLGRTPSGTNARAEEREEVEEELRGRYSPVAPPPVPPRVRLPSERLRQVPEPEPVGSVGP